MLPKKNQNKLTLFVFILLISYVMNSIIEFKSMNDGDLNIIWVCTQCNQNFLFYSDMQDHRSSYGAFKDIQI